MNRKEMIIVGIIILTSFVGGAFAVPAVQQVFVTNFPSNQQVTVSNFPKNQNVTVTNPTSLTSYTTSVDIPLLDNFQSPGITVGPNQNYTAAFSFAPVKGFTQVNSVVVTTVMFNGGGDSSSENGQLNGNALVPSPSFFSCSSILFVFPNQNIRISAHPTH